MAALVTLKRSRLSLLWEAAAVVFLSPLTWLVLVQVCIAGSLFWVGYLSVPEAPEAIDGLRKTLAKCDDAAAHRAQLAYSGVTLGLTLVLAATSAVWALSALLGRGKAFPVAPVRRALITVAIEQPEIQRSEPNCAVSSCACLQ